MKSLSKNNLFATALMLVMTLSFSANANATNSSSSNWLTDLIGSLTSYVQSLKSHDWDWDWDRGHNHDWDKDWELDWDKNWSGNWKNDWDDWKKWGRSNGYNGKWFVCHRTGSSKNPYVMIQVSASGKNAHQAHGDAVSFTDKGNGRCASSGGSTPAPQITSLSLANAEIAVNTKTTLTWSSTNATSCKLDGTTVATSGSANVGPYTSTGTRTLTLACTGSSGSDTESIKLKVINPPKPTVSLSLSKSEILQHSGTANAIWSSTNATSCKLDGTTVATSGTAPVGPYSSTGNKTISVTCTGAGGSASQSVTLKVKSAPAPAPVVTLSLEPSQIAINAKAKLSWSSTGATSCKLQGSGSLYSSSFSITIDTSGYYMKGPFSKAGEATYTVTCTGPGGTDSESVKLTVGATTPAPTVTLSLGTNSIAQNTGTTTATWTSTNANSCTLTRGSLTSSVAVNGTASVGPFSSSGTQTVTINCTGASGTTPASASKTLTVTPPPAAPTVTLTLDTNSILVLLGTATLTWESTNATSCTPGGGTSGSITVGPFLLPGLQSVTVTCIGPGGSASQTVQVNVTDPPPAPTQRLCVSTDMVGNGNEVWIVDYNLQTGEFEGTATTPGEPALFGVAVPLVGVSIADALYTPGTLIDLEAGGVLGLSTGLTFGNGGTGAGGYAQYQINLYLQSAPSSSFGNTRLIFHGATFCNELGGQTPNPR